MDTIWYNLFESYFPSVVVFQCNVALGMCPFQCTTGLWTCRHNKQNNHDTAWFHSVLCLPCARVSSLCHCGRLLSADHSDTAFPWKASTSCSVRPQEFSLGLFVNHARSTFSIAYALLCPFLCFLYDLTINLFDAALKCKLNYFFVQQIQRIVVLFFLSTVTWHKRLLRMYYVADIHLQHNYKNVRTANKHRSV